MHMWQFKNGWVTQFTNDMFISLFRQQIIETTIFIIIL